MNSDPEHIKFKMGYKENQSDFVNDFSLVTNDEPKNDKQA